ncbi:MAG: hypothetical protein ACI94Y_003152, partial [Maribacter sp.]
MLKILCFLIKISLCFGLVTKVFLILFLDEKNQKSPLYSVFNATKAC